MNKSLLKLEKGLSIQELEERYELTVAIPISESLEVAKDDDNDTTICRCGSTCGD